MGKCYFCGASYEGPAYRNSLCASCGKELKICLACAFYDSSAADQCREPRAEKVVDKDRANFCDFFSPSAKSGGEGASSKADEAKRKLEDLFS